ncbi:MAG: MaoC/PaaZ C-terminal domain-containing protein [Noviherbaspirillum sp.]
MAIHYEALMALDIPERVYSYTERDTMLYALGIGFGTDPMDEQELPFVHEHGLKAVPTLPMVATWDRDWVPRTGIDWLKVVHGDQRLRIHRPVPASATVVAASRVSEILDKGKDRGALVRVETVVRDKPTGTPLWTASSGFFARADGGFSGTRMPGPAFHPIPARAPDAVLEAATSPNQALIYRLSGDRNPLHAVPEVARAAGFPRPVLHGLCTYGFACRAVLRAFCGLDPSRISSFDARFSAPMFAGETLRIDMWRDDGIVSFRARCVERDSIVLDNGRAGVA